MFNKNFCLINIIVKIEASVGVEPPTLIKFKVSCF
jgi:hypothetical protein